MRKHPRRPPGRLAARLEGRARSLRHDHPRRRTLLILFPLFGILGMLLIGGFFFVSGLDAQPEPPGVCRTAWRRRSSSTPREPQTAMPHPTCPEDRDGRSRAPRARKYVYAFEEGSQEQKYLLGGKGANLAEMTNIGLPVPPGFTISTDACKAYMAAGDTAPGRAHGRGRRRARDARTEDGQATRRHGRPAARVGAFGCAVLDARDDGHRPQPRAQRRLGEGPREADEQRAVRLRLVPPVRADVRQDRARRAGRPVRGGIARPGRGEGLLGRDRADARAISRGWSRRSRGSCKQGSRRRLPDRSAGAARLRDRGRVQVLERPPRARLPAHGEASPTISAPR